MMLHTHRLPCKAFTRCFSIAVTACSLFLTTNLVTADELTQEQKSVFGLTGLNPISQDGASTVRGSALETRHFGISFISGMLFDPSTASFIKGHSIQLTESSDFVSESQILQPFAESTVTWDREASLQVESTFVDLEAMMRGAVQATGFALSNY